MKRRWIVIPSVVVITLACALYTIDTWVPFLMSLKPEPEIVIDKATRKEAVTTLVAKLNEHYVFPDQARQMETVMLAHLKGGRYDAMTDGEQFARQLSLDLHAVTRDLHMSVWASAEPVPYDREMGPPPATRAEWERRTPAARRWLLELGLMMGKIGSVKVEHLDDNIGYLKLDEFPPSFIMAERYAAAMDELADTGSLIVDLRDNGGGSPETVAMLVSYFVDGRTRLNDLWDRTSGVSMQQWTLDKLDGKRYGSKKPVVILVGPETKSAGEDFAYTMQALNRATVIGKPTWGGAHPTRLFRLGEHFAASIPSRRSINPITGSNWEGVGVIPDIPAGPKQAMDVARDVLQRRLLVPVRQVAAVH